MNTVDFGKYYAYGILSVVSSTCLIRYELRMVSWNYRTGLCSYDSTNVSNVV